MAEKDENLMAMRHSLAHIMASAVRRLWPEAKFGVGPAVADGFYYDIDLGDAKLSEEDFAKIEGEMRKVIGEDQAFERSEKPIDEAVKWAREAGQPYKEELLNDLKRSGTTVAKDLDREEMGTIAGGSDSAVDTVSFYTNGDFTDLCRGPHVESTGKVGAFKLLRVSGAYWRGNEKNPQMQRLYGVAFNTDKELRQHLQMLEEARKRDHRRLGQELDLFVFSDLVGSGLPLFTPRGTVLRDELLGFSEELQRAAGFQKVAIPHITKQALYEKSGHWDKFGEELFLVRSQETSDQFVLKPMNCPHHIQIYAARPRSYRELPIRYMESTMQYRDEKKGELNGLSRVRGISIDDAHVFCTLEQIEGEFTAIMNMIKDMYGVLDMRFRARLSFRDDSDAYLGEPANWEKAQAIIEDVAKKLEIDYFIEEGEAAFYGPKIDIMVTDALGREWQCATQQLDFVQPERFGLTYVAADGSEQRPVMVHKALLGSFERFLSVYIEHTAGRFPVWLAPEQIRVITVNQEDATVEFADKLAAQARELGLRLEIDNSNESVGKKIRAAEVWKVPYTVVVGEKEISSSSVVPRIRQDLAVNGDAGGSIGVEQFLKTVANEAKSRVHKTSLHG
ncbi:MAG TPA: threonine--tRNA ligase [Candidatus Saccharimonadales bacterium]|nr:threonine--tRNA ligase [Candidatus Saccharimonadales bacterium]